MAIAFNNQNNSIGLGSTSSGGFTTSITINSTGVGIGTTNPTSKLWVNGDGYFVGVVTAAKFFGDGSQLTGLTAGVSISTNTTNQSQFIPYVTGTGTTTGFGVTTTGLVFNPSSGNLGIGTTNPTSKLWVSDAGYFIGSVTSEEGFYVNGELIGNSILGTNIVGTSLSISGASNLGETRIRSSNKLRFGGTGAASNFHIQYNSTTSSLDFIAE